MEFVIATQNLHKILELKAMLRIRFSDLDILSLRDFPNFAMPAETGTSFAENAEIKALHTAKATGLTSIGDDSGLVVPALNGEPGLFSRRYAGEKATDKENRNKLIEKLKSIAEEERFAYFECALSVATPDGTVKTVRGISEGHLLLESRGRGGFGYDPLFMKHDYNKTFAELDEDIKNRISHRRKAFDKLIPTIESLLLSVDA